MHKIITSLAISTATLVALTQTSYADVDFHCPIVKQITFTCGDPTNKFLCKANASTVESAAVEWAGAFPMADDATLAKINQIEASYNMGSEIPLCYYKDSTSTVGSLQITQVNIDGKDIPLKNCAPDFSKNIIHCIN